MKSSTKSGRGGARPGAGRKPRPRSATESLTTTNSFESVKGLSAEHARLLLDSPAAHIAITNILAHGSEASQMRLLELLVEIANQGGGDGSFGASSSDLEFWRNGPSLTVHFVASKHQLGLDGGENAGRYSLLKTTYDNPAQDAEGNLYLKTNNQEN
jgi:hypothetical protein